MSLRPEHTVSDEGGLLLDGRAVAALDLHQLDPRAPWLLDRHASGRPRALLSEHPVLAAAVLGLVRGWPAPRAGRDLGATSIGWPLDDAMRATYRLAGEVAPDPYGDPEPLRTWLRAPVGGVPRWLLGLRHSRPDLVAAFPVVPGPDAGRFLAWAATHGRREGVPAELLGPDPEDPRSALIRGGRRLAREAAERTRRWLRTPRTQPGVTVVGFLRGELGIGESARALVAAVDAAGVPCATVPIEPTTGTRSGVPFAARGEGRSRQVTLLCVNADLTSAVADAVAEQRVGSHTVGVWYWEVEDFPMSQHGGFTHLDEVWVATDFVRRALEPHSPVPVHLVPPPLPQRGEQPTLTRTDLGLPEDRTVLLFSFDYLSTAERKNPWGLVEAFGRAVRPGEGPVLVVKSINADRRPGDAERLRLVAADHPDVILREDYLDPVARDALVAHCDAYVSLHRSEGLGLTMAEAMAWGKPVIATGYSGNLHFMTEENSFLVPWTPATVPDDAPPYPPGTRWADPDLDEAARLIRLVVERPDVAAERGRRAAADLAREHSPAAAAVRVAERLAGLGVRPG